MAKGRRLATAGRLWGFTATQSQFIPNPISAELAGVDTDAHFAAARAEGERATFDEAVAFVIVQLRELAADEA